MDETFNLHQTIAAVQQALYGVICHILFDAALHGFVMALALGAIGFVLAKRSNRFGKPLMNVCRRLSLFCVFLAVPGVLALIFQKHLPPTGNYNVNSLGFVIFWSMICVHLSAEETNYDFFHKNEAQEQ